MRPVKYWEQISQRLTARGWNVRYVEAMHDGEAVWTAIAVKEATRHSTHANDLGLAFQELEELCSKKGGEEK